MIRDFHPLVFFYALGFLMTTVGFALGAETRREKGDFNYNRDLSLSFNQATFAGPASPPSIRAKELYAEVLVPVLAPQSAPSPTVSRPCAPRASSCPRRCSSAC